MSEPVPISRSTAAHYQWGAACDGWHLLRPEALSVIQQRMPPGSAELRHRHAAAEFRVISQPPSHGDRELVPPANMPRQTSEGGPG